MSKNADQKPKYEKDSELTQEEKSILSFHRRITQLILREATNEVIREKNDVTHDLLVALTENGKLKLALSKSNELLKGACPESPVVKENEELLND